MPELSRFHGIIVRLYFDDQGQHHRPHVHAEVGKNRASVDLDGHVLAGEIPPKHLTLLRAWLVLRQDQVQAPWALAAASQPFGRIEPLR